VTTYGTAVIRTKNREVLDFELAADEAEAIAVARAQNEHLELLGVHNIQWAPAHIVLGSDSKPIGLKQGDVKIGDMVRMQIDPTGPTFNGGFIEGVVSGLASDGGVVGINVGGVEFSAGLPRVELL